MAKGGASRGFRLKAGLRARTLQEALPFWQKLIAEHPSESLRPRGPLSCRQAPVGRRPVASGRGKPREARQGLPGKPWAGDAHVALIDIKLERLLDLEGAQKNADAAVQWYEKTPPRPMEGAGTTSGPRSARERAGLHGPLSLWERVRVRADTPRLWERAG